MLSVDNMVLGFRRAKTDVRRGQIVEATLTLLADSPLDQLSTRQIARELGISQPALFRHFASRDALLLAVIVETSERLGTLVEGVLGPEGGALARLEALGVQLLRHLGEHPGLPRLLFANLASGTGPVFDALRRLYSMQSSLVAELIRDGLRAGEIDPAIDPRDAATLFVGVLQSVTLIRRLEARSEPLEIEGRRLLSIWIRGVRAAPGSAAQEPVPTPPGEGIRTLDVRPLLGRGTDPFDAITAALAEVGAAGVLVVTAPFRPAPLIKLLTGRGHAVQVQVLGPRHFVIEVIHRGGPEPEDLRDLEPPEPLERVLVATRDLAPGGVYLARLPRHPRLLLPRLEERGLGFRVHEHHDGTALLRVHRSP